MVSSGLDLKTEFSLKPLGSHADSALLGQRLWDHLVSPTDQRRRISIAITVPQSNFFHPGSARSFTCWGSRNDESVDGLIIPLEWKELLPPSSKATCTVQLIDLVCLDEVVVQALSPEAFELAKTQATFLEDWFTLERRILRHGSCYTVDTVATNGMTDGRQAAEDEGFQYRIVDTQPATYGYAKKVHTRFLLLPPSEHEHDIDEEGLIKSVPSSEDTALEEDVEISQDFMAGSLMSRMPIHVSATTSDMHNHTSSASGPSSSLFPQSFSAVPLVGCVDNALYDYTVFIRTSDLTRVGLLDGDWAIARNEYSRTPRLVQLQARDDIAENQSSVHAAPMLLHNMGAGRAISQCQISLHAAPAGIQGHSLPIAQSITVARVASRVTTNRSFQEQVLHSLKIFFEGVKRFVRQGDLIEAHIDIERVQQVRSLANNSDPGGNEQSHADEFDDLAYSSRAKKAVYFVITHVQCGGVTADSSIAELGCWVDSSITRVLQTGVEHARLPSPVPITGNSLSIPPPKQFEADDVPVVSKLSELFSAALTPNAVTYALPVSVLLKGARGTGKFAATAAVASRLGLHLFEVDCYECLGENDVKTEGVIRARFDQAASCAPCIIVIRHLEALIHSEQDGKESSIIAVMRELLDVLHGSWRLTGFPILAIGTTSDPSRVPSGLLSLFKLEIEIGAPEESERSIILRSLLASDTCAPDLFLSEVSRQAAAFVATDLEDLVDRAKSLAVKRSMRARNMSEILKQDVSLGELSLGPADFFTALDQARSSYAQNIGAPSIPNVSWDDVGGLNDVKAEILDTVQLPLLHPELFAQDLKKRSGILLYGPPGTGKTLLAKAVATSCSLNFFSVKGPELLNMYIGESEANVRRVFQRARDAKPCVIFFDELDSIAPKRGSHGDSGGVMDRIVSQLLAELDGIAAGDSGNVFVIGATNRPDLLDPALLRPGRFDRMLYLGISEGNSAQMNVLQALTRKFRLDPDLDLWKVVEQCPFNFTGADFYALCSDALLKAMTRKAEEIDDIIAHISRSSASTQRQEKITPQYYLNEIATSADIMVTVSQKDFGAALSELVPSVSQSEMEHYARIREQFSSRQVTDEEGDQTEEHRLESNWTV